MGQEELLEELQQYEDELLVLPLKLTHQIYQGIPTSLYLNKYGTRALLTTGLLF